MAACVRGQYVASVLEHTVNSSSSKITYEFPCRETAKWVPSILINVDRFVPAIGMGNFI